MGLAILNWEKQNVEGNRNGGLHAKLLAVGPTADDG